MPLGQALIGKRSGMIDREAQFGVGEKREAAELEERLREEEAVPVSEMRPRVHLEEEQGPPRELRVRTRAEVSVSLLRAAQ